MDIIERNPRTRVGAEVAFLISRPDTVRTRHTAYVALAPLRMVLGVGIGTGLQFANPILHTFPTLLTARSGIHGQRRQIVTTHMTVQSGPVRIQLTLRLQSGLLEERCQQSVVVVLQQHFDVQVAGPLQRTVEQGNITKGKLIGIEPILCLDAAHCKEQHHREIKSNSFHKPIIAYHFCCKIKKLFGIRDS